MVSGRMPFDGGDMQTENSNHHGWEWIGDGTGITLVDREYWEQSWPARWCR
jgi:hypothetical protein